MPGDIFPTSRAELDLAEVWCRIAEHDMAAADRLILRLDQRMRLLLDDPMMGDRVEHFDDVRATAVGNYVIYFRRVHDGIEVVRVLHGACRFGDMD